MSKIHRQAAEGEPLEYFKLAEDIEERDLHYTGVLATRKRSVSQLPITVTPASNAADHKKHAEFVQSWIDDGILQAALFDILDAVGKGISMMEIEWRHHAGHTCPKEFIYRPQRWFKFDPEDGETLLLDNGGSGELLIPHKFVIHRHKAKSGLTIRSGIARIASWAWMYKTFATNDWAMFIQNYGMPIRIGKYGPNASDEEKDVLWQAVHDIAGDCAAIIPANMLIEFQEVASKSGSTDLFEKRADFLDRQVSKLVLGQTTTTDAVSGGHAVAKEHRLVQEDIERADSVLLSGTVNAQIIPNMVAFNFGPQDDYPKVHIGRPDEVDLETFADAFDKLGPQGLTADLMWMRSRMGIPTPEDDAELIGGRPISGESAPQLNSFGNPLGKLLSSRHGRQPIEQSIDVIYQRLGQETAGALGGLTDAVRKELMAATSLNDAAERLARLNLDSAELSNALARGMALSHLAGQAALLDELDES